MKWLKNLFGWKSRNETPPEPEAEPVIEMTRESWEPMVTEPQHESNSMSDMEFISEELEEAMYEEWAARRCR